MGKMTYTQQYVNYMHIAVIPAVTLARYIIVYVSASTSYVISLIHYLCHRNHILRWYRTSGSTHTIKVFWCWGQNIIGNIGQYHGCRCPGSWCHQGIISHGIDYKGWVDPCLLQLTHWGQVTRIYVSKLNIIASDNGLSPGQRQAIIWNNAGILSIGLLERNFSEILIEILIFSFKKMRLKMSSVKWRPFCLCLNVLRISHAYISQCWEVL